MSNAKDSRAVVFALLAVLSISTPVYAAGSGHSHAPAATVDNGPDTTARDLTGQLMAAARRLAALESGNQSRALAQLERIAIERRDRLADLIANNPAEALRVAVPNAVAAGLPGQILDLMEENVSFEGELQVVHVHGDDDAEGGPGQSHLEYFLELFPGERVQLHFANSLPKGLTGAALRVEGVFLGGAGGDGTEGAMAVSDSEDDPLVLECCAGDEGSTAGSSGPELSGTTGEQKTIVIMVNFSDDTSEPFTAADIQAVMDGNVDAFMDENSYGQTWVTTDVVGYYTLPRTSAGCDHFGLAYDADAAATADGIDVASYNRRIYAFPKNGCPGSGLGTVGGSPSRSWIYNGFYWTTAAHELGHNLGLYHSNSLDCGADAVSESCTVAEYGDVTDLMGSVHPSHFNAFQKDRLGWIGHNSGQSVTTIENDGSYSVDPYAIAGGTKALKVLRSVDPATGLKTWYYLSGRQAIGFDAALSAYSWSNLVDGITIHSGTEQSGNSSRFLDMTPATESFMDGALEIGLTFNDADAGLTITTTSVTSSTMTVAVTLTSPVCVSANPSVAIDPASGLWAEAGQSVVFDVTVTNQDSLECDDQTFNLVEALPAGWSGSLADSSVLLAPGASTTTTLTVNTPGGASDGYYDSLVTANNASDGSWSGSGTATTIVEAPVNNAPLAYDDSATTEEGGSVVIPVLANDSDPDGDSLSVAAVVESGNGTCVDDGNGNLTYSPAAGFVGTDVFTYTVSDGKGGNASASVTVTVNAAPNGPPVAADDSASTPASDPVTILVLANDQDPDGDALQVTGTGPANKGTVTINADGSLTYTPGRRAKGRDSFSYTIVDGAGNSASAMVSIAFQKGGGDDGGGGSGGGGSGGGGNGKGKSK